MNCRPRSFPNRAFTSFLSECRVILEATVVLRRTIPLTGVVFVIFVAVGLLIAHVVLIATEFGLRNSEEQWVLGLMFG
ncbi:hypothetical protein IE4872_CH01861 [Rhizobium gallicum]|uniref:Uncharacterized protein n=1 Tax=Rhizobium gallicum TaxID=56730 RepID=A0A1L5NHW7_9HYPH|nr:hypothetical protein IE4872_CH01861 [Rhizobium gallicum]